MLSNVLNAGKDIANKIGNKIMNLSELEEKIKESTNDDPWGPQGFIMQEIAEETFSSMNFNETMNFIYYRIFTERPSNGRRTYKGLLLLSYIILNGSDYVALRSKDYLEEIRRLGSQSNGNGVHDASIRKKANDIVELLTNTTHLKSEREKAKNSQVKVYSKKSIDIDQQQTTEASAPRLEDFDSWQPRSKSIPLVIGESFVNLVNILTQNISGPPSTETHDNFDLPPYYQPDKRTDSTKTNTQIQVDRVTTLSKKQSGSMELIRDNVTTYQERPIIDFTDTTMDDCHKGQEDEFGDFRAWNGVTVATSDRTDLGDFFPDFDRLARDHTSNEHADSSTTGTTTQAPLGLVDNVPRQDLKLGSTWDDLGSLKIDLDNVCGPRHPMYSKS